MRQLIFAADNSESFLRDKILLSMQPFVSNSHSSESISSGSLCNRLTSPNHLDQPCIKSVVFTYLLVVAVETQHETRSQSFYTKSRLLPQMLFDMTDFHVMISAVHISVLAIRRNGRWQSVCSDCIGCNLVP